MAIVEEFQKQEKIKNPISEENQDFGFSFRPGTCFDWMCLCIIKKKKIKNALNNPLYRVPFVDLGCGSMGFMSALAMFAGAVADAVDFREAVTEANKQIYQDTRDVIGYTKDNAKTYYRAFPQSLTEEALPSWAQIPHLIAYCANVVPYFTESEIQRFAGRIFDNLMPDGILFLQADTPLFSKASFSFYQNQQGQVLCPGLAVYNKEKGSEGLKMIGKPVSFIETTHTIRPAYVYEGEFTETGDVIANSNCYHNVRNLFLVEDLARIFENAGFKTNQKFYLDSTGQRTEELPKLGKASKACVILIKPING